ncbi:hypothetical protein Oscil6304_2767 [Oscillatoria acuminata PCC 6304]|uniref:Uncharacterized protein n=2 Tax=Oscillatoria acuminata TaxID=118323 RepID=K9TK39_9CYAN|nr:hypothetical protein Oscil6304_2767 [Oscillatoria acuminata PCC 6304]
MGISPLLQKVEIMPILQILAPEVSSDEEAEGPSEYKPEFCKIEIAATEEPLKKLLSQEKANSDKERLQLLCLFSTKIDISLLIFNKN